MGFSALDYVLFLIILFFMIRGTIRGFINDVFGLGSLVIAVFSGIRFFGYVQAKMNLNMPPIAASAICFLMIFVVVYVIMKIIQALVKSIFSIPVLNSLDKALGFLLGTVLGIMIVCVILFVLSQFDLFQGLRSDSTLYNYFMNLTEDNEVLKQAV